MSEMFQFAKAFNQPIGSWDTSGVTAMRQMFSGALVFNQPIGSWDTSSVASMGEMFFNAESFQQQLSTWMTYRVRDSYKMFEGAHAFVQPPCPAGHFPSLNGLGCEPCLRGRYSGEGAANCSSCSLNSVPSKDQTTCEDCPVSQFALEDSEICTACNLPLLLMDAQCIWWHLPLVALAVASIFVMARLLLGYRRARRLRKAETIFQLLDKELWDAEPSALQHSNLKKLGVCDKDIDSRIAAMAKEHSEKAGVGMRYILSSEFFDLATQRTGKGDPTFMDMKTSFWCEDDKLGASAICPRDGRPGCALVDWIPRSGRREQTHFMSWTWQYRLSQVRSALDMYKANSQVNAEQVFFFMCFFVNNQFRIILEETQTGSQDLENVFHSNLKRVGQMVAVLDTWQKPVYLDRVWTVYEQFVASTLEIPVTFVMPEQATALLNEQIYRGKVGVNEVTWSLSQIDSARAKAWKQEDEDYVKGLIQEKVGFAHINQHVTQVMVRWVGDVVARQFHELIYDARQAAAPGIRPETMAESIVPSRRDSLETN